MFRKARQRENARALKFPARRSNMRELKANVRYAGFIARNGDDLRFFDDVEVMQSLVNRSLGDLFRFATMLGEKHDATPPYDNASIERGDLGNTPASRSSLVILYLQKVYAA